MSKKLIPALLIAGGALCVAVLAAWVFYYYKFGRQTPAPPGPKVANVVVETVRAVPELPDVAELPAVVEPGRTVTVSAEVAGRVEKLAVEEGAACKAGQVLVELDTELLKAARDGAKARAELARLAFLRTEKLQKAGAARGEELEAARASRDATAAALVTAEARLKRASIAAPIPGALDDLGVEKGEYVTAGTPVARIVDSGRVKAAVMIPERDAQYIKAGTPAEVTCEVKGRKRVFVAKVTYLSLLADRATRAARAEVMIDNKERLLRGGRIVTVRLTRRVLKDAVMVPLTAVIPLERGHVVYVVEEGRSVRVVALCAGLSREKTEESVTAPIRAALKGLKGLGKVRAYAQELKLKVDAQLVPEKRLSGDLDRLVRDALKERDKEAVKAKSSFKSAVLLTLKAEFTPGADMGKIRKLIDERLAQVRKELPASARIVAVEAGDVARRREVRLDTSVIKTRKGVQCVRILAGLKPGEKLIVAGQAFVGPGQPVSIQKLAAPEKKTPGAARE